MELSANDSLWLNMDSPENLMVIESVMWFHHRLDPDAVIQCPRGAHDRALPRVPLASRGSRRASGAGTSGSTTRTSTSTGT